jgi:hypothetical protein
MNTASCDCYQGQHSLTNARYHVGTTNVAQLLWWRLPYSFRANLNPQKGISKGLPEVHASPSIAPYIDPRRPRLSNNDFFRLGFFWNGTVKDPLQDVQPWQLEQVLQVCWLIFSADMHLTEMKRTYNI